MSAVSGRDPRAVAAALPLLRLAMEGYFRSSVRGMDHVPEGGALIVSNHSGGLLPMDVPILAVAFAREFGADRPIYCLAHDLLFTGAAGPVMRRFGFLPATRENAHEVLTSGGVTIVFPGGDYDTFRPSSRANVVDFAGRTGYVRTAQRAGVPIVPAVSIGGQEAQLHLTRGEWIGRRLGIRRWLRSDLFPLSVGFPFGVTGAVPPNLPLPTKISTEVLAPVSVPEDAGDAGVAAVDVEVRGRMQAALDDLAARRRFPVLG